MPEKEDAINPAHYNKFKHKPIDIIEEYGLGFCLGNTVKYILRHEHKGAAIEDLQKARWYLDREIQRREAAGS